MSIINYSATRKLLTVARGHPYERDAFAGLFSGLDEFEVCHVEQPVVAFSMIVTFKLGSSFLASTAEKHPALPPPMIKRSVSMISVVMFSRLSGNCIAIGISFVRFLVNHFLALVIRF